MALTGLRRRLELLGILAPSTPEAVFRYGLHNRYHWSNLIPNEPAGGHRAKRHEAQSLMLTLDEETLFEHYRAACVEKRRVGEQSAAFGFSERLAQEHLRQSALIALLGEAAHLRGFARERFDWEARQDVGEAAPVLSALDKPAAVAAASDVELVDGPGL